jgi:hypothetical protein
MTTDPDADAADELEPVDTAADQAPHVSLGYPTPTGWVVGAYDVNGPAAGHAEVGEPSDMRRVKAPVNSEPVDLSQPDVPMVTEVSVITGTE